MFSRTMKRTGTGSSVVKKMDSTEEQKRKDERGRVKREEGCRGERR